MMAEARKAGRPAKPPGEKYETPGRRLGRVSDEEWGVITNNYADKLVTNDLRFFGEAESE